MPPQTIRAAHHEADLLRESLSMAGLCTLTQEQALESIARMAGYRDWDTCSA